MKDLIEIPRAMRPRVWPAVVFPLLVAGIWSVSADIPPMARVPFAELGSLFAASLGAPGPFVPGDRFHTGYSLVSTGVFFGMLLIHFRIARPQGLASLFRDLDTVPDADAFRWVILFPWTWWLPPLAMVFALLFSAGDPFHLWAFLAIMPSTFVLMAMDRVSTAQAGSKLLRQGGLIYALVIPPTALVASVIAAHVILLGHALICLLLVAMSFQALLPCFDPDQEESSAEASHPPLSILDLDQRPSVTHR